MSDDIDTYPEHPRSKVKRLAARAAYDYATIHNIISSSPLLHVSFVPDGTDPFPTTLALLGALGASRTLRYLLPSGPLDIYLHGWSSSRLARLAAESADDGGEGLPVSVSTAQIDGYVLALSPFHHSLNYRSAVAHGYATRVTDPAERLYALERLTDAIVTKRWANTRGPPTAVELQSTAVLKVTIESASAKIRRGGPKEDRADEEDENVRGKVWTGVIPTRETLGEPIPAATNRVELPTHLKEWIAEKEAGSVEVAKVANTL